MVGTLHLHPGEAVENQLIWGGESKLCVKSLSFEISPRPPGGSNRA